MTLCFSNRDRSRTFLLLPKIPYRLWDQITLPLRGYRSTVLGIKRRGHEVYLLSSSIAEVKNEWSHNSVPFIRLHGVDTAKLISLQCQ